MMPTGIQLAENLAWIVAAAAFVLLLFVSRSTRRLLTTMRVAGRALFAWLRGRLAGKKDEGAAHLRRAFEELGPTYIKLGQIIASSHGLFPERYCREFEKCFDRVPPVSFAEARAVMAEELEAELGMPLDEIFARIDEEPLASASIAQVHAAVLADGREVVVKVQRPGIPDRIDSDLRIMGVGAALFSILPRGDLANPTGIVEDFDVTIHQELDFLLEAQNLDEFNSIMRGLGHTDVLAPAPVHRLTTRRILVMERFRGFRVDDVAEMKRRNVNGEEKLLKGMRAWFQCLILHGFFHGDVHAGNLMALDDGRIGFLDFGIVGRFGEERRRQITDYLLSFAAGDFRRVGEVMIRMGSVGGDINLDVLARDLEKAYRPLLTQSFGNVKYADLIPRILGAALKHKMRLPSDFVLVTKQMLYFDRYARLLAPELNLFTDPRIISGLAEDVMRAQFTNTDV